jgi:hypothetical protein
MGSRRPMGRRVKTGPPPTEAPDYGPDPLYAVFRNGRRVYLPGDRPGLPLEIAEAQARALESSEVVEVYGGQE